MGKGKEGMGKGKKQKGRKKQPREINFWLQLVSNSLFLWHNQSQRQSNLRRCNLEIDEDWSERSLGELWRMVDGVAVQHHQL